jgi:hypothetical protein
MCRGICEKIREQWGSPFNPFESFVKDVFGKCEICFRAGYCTISQCKEQESNERQIIDHIVNSATLTAKINNNLIVSFPTANPDDQEKVIKINNGIEKILYKDIDKVRVLGSTDVVVPKLHNMFSNYLLKAFTVPNATPKMILEFNPSESANIPYYTGTAAEKLITKTEESIKKLEESVGKLSEIEKLADKGHIKEAKKEAGALEKTMGGLDKKFAEAEKKLDEQINKLNTMAAGVKDEKAAADIQSTIQNVKTAEKAAHEAHKAIENDKKQLRRLKK